MQGLVTGERCKLKIVLEFVTVLDRTHSKLDLVLVYLLLARDKEVVKGIADALYLSLVASMLNGLHRPAHSRVYCASNHLRIIVRLSWL